MKQTLPAGPRLSIPCGAVALLLLVAGCGTASGTRPDAGRLSDLQAQADAAPDDAVARRTLGEAYAEAGDLDAARRHLLDAEALAPEDARTYYALGLVEEALGNRDEALARYQDAPPAVAADVPYGRLIAGRRVHLARQLAEDDVRAAREGVPLPTQLPEAVAIVPLEGRDDEAARWVGPALREILAAEIASAPIAVTEAARITAVHDALGLGAGNVDAARARRVGDLVRSRYVVSGTVSVRGEAVRAELDVWDAARDTPSRLVARNGRLGDVGALARDLADGVLDVLGVEPEGASGEVGSVNAEALLAFGRGLAAQDAGRYDEAGERYGEALQADPGFALAAARAAEADLLRTNPETPAAAFATLAPRPVGPDLIARRLTALGQSVGANVVPGEVSRQPAAESSPVLPPRDALPTPPAPPGGN